MTAHVFHPRSRLAAGVALSAALGVLMFPSASLATHSLNVFSGRWSTTLSGGEAGSVTFKVAVAGDPAAELVALGGRACGQPATYYRGEFSSVNNPGGMIVGCTATGGNHLVGRYKGPSSNSPAGTDDIDITFAAPGSFSGQQTSGGISRPYLGTFVSHTSDDGSSLAPPGSVLPSCSAAPRPGPRRQRGRRRGQGRRRARLRAHASACQNFWGANWSTDAPRFGTVSFVENDAFDHVDGTYGGGGTLKGDLSSPGIGGVLSGTFTDSADGGTFSVRLSATGDDFEGTYTPNGGSPVSWKGRKG